MAKQQEQDSPKWAQQEKQFLGLKKLRKSSGKEPIYSCDNCKCNRYSPCNCMKSEKKRS